MERRDPSESGAIASMVLWRVIAFILPCLVGLAAMSCSSRGDQRDELLNRYLSMRSVLFDALDLTWELEEALKGGFPGARDEIEALVQEGRKVISSLRSSLREYRAQLEGGSLQAILAENLRHQAELIERCAGELEVYLGISSNLARDFPFQKNPAQLSFALEQLNQSWSGLRDNLRALRDGESELLEIYEGR